MNHNNFQPLLKTNLKNVEPSSRRVLGANNKRGSLQGAQKPRRFRKPTPLGPVPNPTIVKPRHEIKPPLSRRGGPQLANKRHQMVPAQRRVIFRGVVKGRPIFVTKTLPVMPPRGRMLPPRNVWLNPQERLHPIIPPWMRRQVPGGRVVPSPRPLPMPAPTPALPKNPQVVLRVPLPLRPPAGTWQGYRGGVPPHILPVFRDIRVL